MSAEVQSKALGGSKPIHRFLRGQPKSIGCAVVIMGVSLLVVTIAIMTEIRTVLVSFNVRVTFILGSLFIASGILYIMTDHYPSKKTVTISLALSISSILAAGWTNLRILPHIGYYYHYRPEIYYDDNMTEIFPPYSNYDTEKMMAALDVILVCQSFVGAIVFVVMSAFAGAALRSTKSQAIVVMTALPTEAVTELQP